MEHHCIHALLRSVQKLRAAGTRPGSPSCKASAHRLYGSEKTNGVWHDTIVLAAAWFSNLASPSMRLNATMRWGSLIGLRMQHVLSRLNVRKENYHRQYGERDGVGRENKRGHGTPHWMRVRNEEHPRRRTSAGRVALLWKQLGMTSHILAVRENGSKHLSTHILGGERRPMFAPSTPAPVISVREITC